MTGFRLTALIFLMLFSALAGCGKKGELEAPERQSFAPAPGDLEKG